MPKAPEDSACYDCVRYDDGDCYLLVNYLDGQVLIQESIEAQGGTYATPPVSKDCHGFLRVTKTRQSTEDLKEPTIAEARPPDEVAPTKLTKDNNNG